MSWGSGGWGSTPWGTGTVLPPPTLSALSSLSDPTAPTAAPSVVNILGGTVCVAAGTNFYARESLPYIDVEILTGGPGAYTQVAAGFVFDPVFDIAANRIYFGCPALVRGLYHVRVSTDSGSSQVLENALSAREFADEYKTVSVRGKFAPTWDTGPRVLKGES